MQRKLINKLKKKYPQLLKHSYDWAIGDGWYWILDNLFFDLQIGIQHNNEEPIEISQIKEKFGRLRVYTNGATGEQYKVIHFAELLSGSMCEDCGSIKNSKLRGSAWVRTLCDICWKEIQKN